MDYLLNRPHIFAYIAGTIFPLTCFVSYILALSLNHIPPVITYISDASTDPPVSGVFGMLLTYSMLSFGAVTYFRCKLVRHVCEVRPEIASSKVLLANNVSGWLAFISVVCLIFVAHFQVNTTLLLHGFTAFVGIGLGVIYCCMQVISTKAMIPHYTAPSMLYFRLTLAVLSVISFVFGVLSALLSISKFKGEQLHRWNPEDGGYVEHAISSVCEWVLAAVYAAYVFSFSHELKHVQISGFKVIWIGSENGKLGGDRDGNNLP